ncbi:MAG: type I-G CRISPR-associated protein Cas8g1/Csx17 [Myxococcaceae bacterium]
MTALHLHRLTGCAPAPLAYYLKALGVLRIVAEQKDPAIRGWWQDEHFCLLTTLDHSELQRFFLEEYAPTGVLNPWGARSGFYPGSSEKSAREALQKIEKSKIARLSILRSAITTIRGSIDEIDGKKPEDDETKNLLLGGLRRKLRGPNQAWVDTAMAIIGDDYRTPALMGTGGNEGSGSYSSAFLKATVACIINRSQDHALGLFHRGDEEADSPINGYAWKESFGQFLPEGEASAWDLLLAFEGAIVFRSTVTLRSHASQRRFLSSPFYFAPHAAGAGTSARIDEVALNKGRENPGRGEQWFPLWALPCRLDEIAALVGEGRCTIGRRHANRALDAARAVSQLGTARGISSFCRYGYLQRNNLATHFAVPLGRIDVRNRPHAKLIDDIAPWQDRLHGCARKKSSPVRLIDGERSLANSVFAVLTHDGSAERWQAVLLAAADVEAIQASGTAFKAGPIPSLSPEWVAATNDGSVEWRLACALGSAAATYENDATPRDPIRHHWLPLEKGARRFREKDKRLLRDPRVVIGGRDAVADFAAVVERRLIEAAQRGQRRLPLVAARGGGAHPVDLGALIAGDADLGRVSALARAFMAVRWHQWKPAKSAGLLKGAWPDEAWIALRLACLPWPLDQNRSVSADDALIRRLMSGDGSTAVEIALRRLRAAGLRPPIRGASADASTARLWAAALAFPVSHYWACAMARSFEPTNNQENR